MISVPLKPVPNQATQVVLGGQSCVLRVYQLAYGMFVDVYVNGGLIVAGVACQNLNRVVRSLYLGFSGDLTFWDSQGADDPQDPVYTGLGTRFLLLYVTAAELEGAGR